MKLQCILHGLKQNYLKYAILTFLLSRRRPIIQTKQGPKTKGQRTKGSGRSDKKIMKRERQAREKGVGRETGFGTKKLSVGELLTMHNAHGRAITQR